MNKRNIFSRTRSYLKNHRKKILFCLLMVFIFYLFVAVYHVVKPLPPGVSLEGEIYYVNDSDVDFLYDLTYLDEGGRGGRVSDQEIFDQVFSVIDKAEQFILIDFFLYNDYQGSKPELYRNLSSALTQLLIEKKKKNPEIKIIVISDPLNVVYGGDRSWQFEALEDEGISVVITDLGKLRDSNPFYSGFWRLFIQWFGNSAAGGIFPHPFSAAENGVSMRSWLALFNFKANHRKLIVADAPDDNGRGMVSMVMSANPHDGSSAHNNGALFVKGGIWRDIIKSEQAVLDFSGSKIDLWDMLPKEIQNLEKEKGTGDNLYGGVEVRVLTEGKIRNDLITEIDKTSQEDSIDVAMFYLSDREIVDSLLKAADRGVSLRVLLDPNKDAFGHEKNGIPNRQVALELLGRTGRDIQVRWYDTHGEQFHTKIILIKTRGRTILYVGSANLTRRNIGDYNLETDVKVVDSGIGDVSAIIEAERYFEKIWGNEDHAYSVSYEKYEDLSFRKRWQYRFMEWSGLSTF